jgi:hypothetical protein
MRADPVLFERFRDASEGMIPHDLRAWALAVIGELIGARGQLEARDHLLRRAAAAHGGTKGSRIRRLLAELKSPGPPTDPVSVLVCEALAAAPGRRAPSSKRQLIRILR